MVLLFVGTIAAVPAFAAGLYLLLQHGPRYRSAVNIGMVAVAGLPVFIIVMLALTRNFGLHFHI